jgi:hypothetical protein
MGYIVVIAYALALACNAAELRSQDFDENEDGQVAEKASNESIDQLSNDTYNAVVSSSLPVKIRKINPVFVFGKGKTPSVTVTPKKWNLFVLPDFIDTSAVWWTKNEDPHINSWMNDQSNASWLNRQIRYEPLSVKSVNVDMNPQLKQDFITSANVPNPDMYTDNGCLSRNGAKALFRHMPNDKQVDAPNINIYFVHCVVDFNTSGMTDNNFEGQAYYCWEYPPTGSVFYNSSIISDLPWENLNNDPPADRIKIMHYLLHEEGHAQRFFHPLYGCPAPPVPENYCTNRMDNDPNFMSYWKYAVDIGPFQQENIYKIVPVTSPDELQP